MEGIDLTSALLTREAHQIMAQTVSQSLVYCNKQLSETCSGILNKKKIRHLQVPAFYKQTKILYLKKKKFNILNLRALFALGLIQHSLWYVNNGTAIARLNAIIHWLTEHLFAWFKLCPLLFSLLYWDFRERLNH